MPQVGCSVRFHRLIIPTSEQNNGRTSAHPWFARRTLACARRIQKNHIMMKGAELMGGMYYRDSYERGPYGSESSTDLLGLLQAMMRQGQVEPRSDLNSRNPESQAPAKVSNDGLVPTTRFTVRPLGAYSPSDSEVDRDEGGLLRWWRALQVEQSRYQPAPPNREPMQSVLQNPNFRQLSRAPVGRMTVAVHPDVGGVFNVQSQATRGNGLPLSEPMTIALDPTPQREAIDALPAESQVMTTTTPVAPLERYASNTRPFHPSFSETTPNRTGVHRIGVTSDQSVYCQTMKKICHDRYIHLALRPDGFGPYRSSMRTCMQGAGCFDF
jgi:hypothetical protein